MGDRLVVYSGLMDAYYPERFDDVWSLSLMGTPVWTKLFPSGDSPGSRESASAIYDPLRHRMVVFGGVLTAVGGTQQVRRDVWALSLGGEPQWTELAPSGTTLARRYGHSAVYDPVRDRMIVFGGAFNSTTYLDEVWELSLSGAPSWRRLFPSGASPGPRAYHTAVYDPLRQRMVVFGGYYGALRDTSDVWELTLSGSPAWNRLLPAGGPPGKRQKHSAAYDPVRDRMLVFAGAPHDGNSLYDAWALSLDGVVRWDSLGSDPAVRRCSAAAALDPTRDRVVVFGGRIAENSYSSAGFNDVWALDAGSTGWTRLAANDGRPPLLSSQAAIYDPAGKRFVVHGGFDGTGYRSDAWALSLGAIPTWTSYAAVDSQPGPRGLHVAICDQARGRIVIFGGYDGASLRNDVWAASLGDRLAWVRLDPLGTPPSPRTNAAGVYDPLGDRMLVIGGYDGTAFRNDVWELSLAGSPAWSQLTPSGPPPAGRSDHSAVYDLPRPRVVVFGGYDGAYRKDVWALSLDGAPAWSELVPQGPLPNRRAGHTAIHDAARDRMVIFGGDSLSTSLNDVWALSLGSFPAWAQLAPDGVPPWKQRDHTAAYDPLWDRMVVGHGWGGDEMTWILHWASTVGVEPGPRQGRPRWTVSPNPIRSRVRIGLELPTGAPVRVVIFDLAGRRVRDVFEGTLPPGRHELWWDGSSASGPPAPTGIYFCGLSAGAERAARKIVLIH